MVTKLNMFLSRVWGGSWPDDPPATFKADCFGEVLIPTPICLFLAKPERGKGRFFLFLFSGFRKRVFI